MDKVASHWDISRARVISQYWDAEKWLACLKAVTDQYDTVEDEAWDLAYSTDFLGLAVDIPTGARLDFVGGLIGLARESGEGDTAYYDRLVDYTQSRQSGTIGYITKRATAITGDAEPLYFEENFGFPFSASGVLFTKSETQVTRLQAKKIKACGTRLFVGGCVKASSSSLVFATTSGKKILAVGGPYETTTYAQSQKLTAETGEYLITENGNNMVTEGAIE